MQSYSNIEHIIVDGNSKDNTIKIIEENRSKLSKFICEIDNGPFDAFNKGIKQATGDFIGFVHSDDMLVSKDIIKKLQLINYDLEDYSLDTVKMFYKDAVDAGFKIS